MGAELVTARLRFPKWPVYLEILKKGLTGGKGKEQMEKPQFLFYLVGSFPEFLSGTWTWLQIVRRGPH